MSSDAQSVTYTVVGHPRAAQRALAGFGSLPNDEYYGWPVDPNLKPGDLVAFNPQRGLVPLSPGAVLVGILRETFSHPQSPLLRIGRYSAKGVFSIQATGPAGDWWYRYWEQERRRLSLVHRAWNWLRDLLR